ncbi:MAG: ATP-binding protein [Candidatus Desulforudis sp.]|nr:ATP-binding protein [Desulforudis sp.]
MSRKLNVQVSNDHIQRMITNVGALRALKELIWNALDADATIIKVSFVRGALDGIEEISVTDNGHGISHDDIDHKFGKLGDSHKIREFKSPGGRMYHGKRGEGRYKVFNLGHLATWRSVYLGMSNNALAFTIEGSRSNPSEVLVSEPAPCSEQTGVRVSVLDPIDKVAQLDNPDTVIGKLTEEFAAYLLAYPEIRISVDGVAIKTREIIDEFVDLDLRFVTEEQESIEAKVRLIIWKRGNFRNRFLCNSEGVAYAYEPSRIRHVPFNYSIYILSNYIEHMAGSADPSAFLLRNMNPVLRELVQRAENVVRIYFREKLAIEASDTIRDLKDEGVYPYQGSPANEIDNAKRQIFDICAVKIHQFDPNFIKSPTTSKRLTLRLIKEAIDQNPTTLKKILTEVLSLPVDTQEEFADLLERTSLKAIVNAGTTIANRLDFLSGLEHILFSPDFRKGLRERSQLHKILVNELWIFGEQYVLGQDDASLKTVLREYVRYLGREELAKDIPPDEMKDLIDIPDLCLWAKLPVGKPGQFSNLVVELKRPLHTLTTDDLAQIEKYAFEVAQNPRFSQNGLEWTFVLVGNSLNDTLKWKCKSSDRPYGLVVQTGAVNVWVKEWSDILRETNWRYQFLRDQLELVVQDNAEGMAYLSKKYGEILKSNPKTKDLY